MLIEQLTHENYIQITKMIPLKMKVGEIKVYAKKIAEKFSLPEKDSIGSLFVAFSIKTGNSVLGYEAEKKRRIAQVVAGR